MNAPQYYTQETIEQCDSPEIGWHFHNDQSTI